MSNTLFVREIFLTILLLALTTNSYAVVVKANLFDSDLNVLTQSLNPELQKIPLEDLLKLTPKRYKELTGEKLGIKNAIKLKAAQNKIKKIEERRGMHEIVYILLALIFLGWLGIGLSTGFYGGSWAIALLLYLLCGLPGIVYTLIKKNSYY